MWRSRQSSLSSVSSLQDDDSLACCRVFVSPQGGKFPNSVTWYNLRKHFRSKFHKQVVSAYIMRNRQKVSRGFGTVKFTSTAVAEEAITRLTGTLLLDLYPLYIGFQKDPSVFPSALSRSTAKCGSSLSLFSGSYIWLYEDDSYGYSQYSTSDSSLIEQMYKGEAVRQHLRIGRWTYEFDFHDMKQINIQTKRRRMIKRVPTSQGIQSKLFISKSLSLPSTLTSSSTFQSKLDNVIRQNKFTKIKVNTSSTTKSVTIEGEEPKVLNAFIDIQSEIIHFLDDTDQYPDEWSPQSKTCELFEVSKYSGEGTRISSQFRETMPENTIMSIKRVQNKLLWGKYYQSKKLKIKNNGYNSEREKQLFHGSKSTCADDIVCSDEGFDMRLSSSGMWGQANYFAVNASYSDTYAYRHPNNRTKELFLVKVLTGDSITLSPDQSLRMPPEKTMRVGATLEHVRYDSVNGVARGSVVYMTYSNERAYPAYIICYI